MGIRRLTVTVCDNCGKDRLVTQWRITHVGVSRNLDLCSECAVPVARLHATGARHDVFSPATDEQIAQARLRRAASE